MKNLYTNSAGFTLLELLITITIIGIIAATAIPQYSEYKKRAFDSRARTDLMNVALAEEAYFIDNESYLSCSGTSCTNLPGIAGISSGVDINIIAASDSFTGTASHNQGTGKTYTWDSQGGGLTE